MEMISYEEAYKTVINSAFSTGTELVSFTASPGRILAQDVKSDMNMPPFDKSTVDGFACRRADLGSELVIIETIPAGKRPEKKTGEGECSRIMTGAPVPEGADCVIMVEESLIMPSGRMKFTGIWSKSNISEKGEDIRNGDIVLKSGKQINPQDIAVLASAGCTSLLVSKSPVAGIISSGDELVEPHEKPGHSKIRNSNAYQLMAQAERSGALGRYYGIARDNENETFAIVEKAITECSIVLISGGVSMGDFDFVPSVLERVGVKILFSRVNVQPGKPTTFGIHPHCLVFGLPGNPVSSFIQFELLVRPLISRMMGNKWNPLFMELPMKVAYERRASDRMGLVPVIITEDRQVLPVEYHGSADILSISLAHGVITLPAGRKIIKEGEIVSVRQI